MENLGAMAYSRYTGFHEITDRDVLELHCTSYQVWSQLAFRFRSSSKQKINFFKMAAIAAILITDQNDFS